MMNDSYLISMFYRPRCIVGPVVLFLKAVVIAKRLTKFWVVIIIYKTNLIARLVLRQGQLKL